MVLVAVHRDGQLARCLRCLQHPQATGSGRGVDHLGTALELATRQPAPRPESSRPVVWVMSR